MKNLDRTTLLIILNLSIGLIYGLEEFSITNFLSNSALNNLELAFFITMVLWNISLIIDKRKKK